jgi:WXXGXW repeat (2 copies)
MRIVRPSSCWLLAVAVLCVSAASFAQVAVVVSFAPPALPVYEQPVCPAEGYIWTPGYWAFDDEFGDYYWVPGTWVPAPEPDLFWTPPYWAWNGSAFAFYPGYWGPQVGFYGGIDYGFGYFGQGYEGGRWDHGRFYYNRAVNNINVENVHNVYETKVNERTINHVSYNGGQGGIEARPTAEDERAMNERHVAAVEAQTRQMQAARSDQQLRASVNHGRPPIAATPRPGEFNEHGIVPAKEAGAPYHPPARPPVPVHAKNLPPHTMPPPNVGSASENQKYQQEQQQMLTKQNQEHQKLAQQQEEEHQRMAQQHADAARTQQMERQHQQQTQQMEQRHTQQQQQLRK